MNSLLTKYKTKTTILDSTIDVRRKEMESVKSDVETLFQNKTNEFWIHSPTRFPILKQTLTLSISISPASRNPPKTVHLEVISHLLD